MQTQIAANEWAVVSQQGSCLELRWLTKAPPMTDGAFMATLCLFVWEAERARAGALLVDATEFRHRFGDGVMAWRDAHITPRYGAAGVRKLAFVMPPSFPDIGKEAVDGPAVFPTKWFSNREEALLWLHAK
jgi:hypothetical protein